MGNDRKRWIKSYQSKMRQLRVSPFTTYKLIRELEDRKEITKVLDQYVQSGLREAISRHIRKWR